MTTVPLDSSSTDHHDLMERLRQSTAKLKILTAENAELNEKLKVASVENQELNRNIEELDTQHQIAIEKVLDVKRSLQNKLNEAEKRFEAEKLELTKAHEKLRAEFDEELSSHKEIVRDYEMQIDELSEANAKLESEVSSEPEVIVNSAEVLKKFTEIVNKSFKLNEKFDDEESFGEWLAATAVKLRELNFEKSKLVDENKLIREEAMKNASEREALKVDLEHYEIECSELMKNNNILMADIESLKLGGKLETILENDEELERQLEDSNNLNQNLEDEFQSIRTKLEATEVERSEYYGEIQKLKNQLAENVTRCKEYQEEIQTLENEKCNYLFELNELKSEEERNILQRELKLSKDREFELTKRIEELEKEKIATCHDEEASKEVEVLKVKLKEIEKEKSEFLSVAEAKQNLEKKCDELERVNDANLANLKKSNEIVQELQKKILESEAKISSLEGERDSLIHESIKDSIEIENFEREMKALESLKEELLEKDRKLSEISSQLSSAENELSIVKSEIENLQTEKSDLIHQLNTVNTDRESINLQLLELQKVHDENSQKSLETIEKLKQDLEEKASVTSSDSKLDETLKALDDVKNELASSETARQDLSTQLEAAKSSQQSLQTELHQKIQESSEKVSTLETSLAGLTKEKEDLIALITTKHNENVQYHNEIVRLNQLLQQESKKDEFEALNDQVKFLREKCDLLAQNLLQEQSSLRLLQQEKNDALEQNNTLNRDIERLRQHLLEVADAYTFEQISLQKQVEEYKSKLMAIEADAKQSANAYTSANIRANQQAETLQSQYNLLAQQRDELLAKLGAAEDKDNKNQAALTNLQIALEIFQKGKNLIFKKN